MFFPKDLSLGVQIAVSLAPCSSLLLLAPPCLTLPPLAAAACLPLPPLAAAACLPLSPLAAAAWCSASRDRGGVYGAPEAVLRPQSTLSQRLPQPVTSQSPAPGRVAAQSTLSP